MSNNRLIVTMESKITTSHMSATVSPCETRVRTAVHLLTNMGVMTCTAIRATSYRR